MKKKIFLSILIFALLPTLFGFQSMNHKEFFVLFNHKIGESYKRIELLNKKSNLAKLGKEEAIYVQICRRRLCGRRWELVGCQR